MALEGHRGAARPSGCKPARRQLSARVGYDVAANAAVMERKIAVPGGWRGKYGASLANEHIRLRFAGNLNGPFVVVLGGISAGRHVGDDGEVKRGWWAHLAKPGGAVDLTKFCVIGMDYPPTSLSEAVDLCPEDFADFLKSALDKAKVKRLHAFIGSSFGGMIGLAFARKYPSALDRLCVISAAHRPSVMAQAWRLVQRRTIAFAVRSGAPEEGVALARQLAMTTYRTPEEFEHRFDSRLEAADNVGYYLESRGYDYAGKMSAARYLTLSAAIDRHQENPEDIKTSTLVIGVDSDRLTPIADMKTLQRRLGGPSAFAIVASDFGHDAFLKETDALGRHLRNFLSEERS